MTNLELKELVKAHFSLVEKTELTTESFGELEDINSAFTIKFPGDSIQVGDKVTVVTAEGQEMDAPDGTHEMKDGTKIVTKNSVVEEIMSADGEKELSAEKMADVEEVIEEVVESMEEEATPVVEVSVEEIIAEIADALKEEMAAMKTKMSELETKMEELLDAPAAEATILTPTEQSKAKFSMFNVEGAANAARIKAAMAMIKNKK